MRSLLILFWSIVHALNGVVLEIVDIMPWMALRNTHTASAGRFVLSQFPIACVVWFLSSEHINYRLHTKLKWVRVATAAATATVVTVCWLHKWLDGDGGKNDKIQGTCTTAADYAKDIDVIFILTVCPQQIALDENETETKWPAYNSWAPSFISRSNWSITAVYWIRIMCGRVCMAELLPFYPAQYTISAVLLHKSHISRIKLCTNIRNASLSLSLTDFFHVDNVAAHQIASAAQAIVAANYYFDNNLSKTSEKKNRKSTTTPRMSTTMGALQTAKLALFHYTQIHTCRL